MMNHQWKDISVQTDGLTDTETIVDRIEVPIGTGFFIQWMFIKNLFRDDEQTLVYGLYRFGFNNWVTPCPCFERFTMLDDVSTSLLVTMTTGYHTGYTGYTQVWDGLKVIFSFFKPVRIG